MVDLTIVQLKKLTTNCQIIVKIMMSNGIITSRITTKLRYELQNTLEMFLGVHEENGLFNNVFPRKTWSREKVNLLLTDEYFHHCRKYQNSPIKR